MLKRNSQQGFTIVELLIVIVVIGILAALVLNTFSGVQRRARDTERQTDINSIATQLEVYYNDMGGYPILATSSTNGLANDSWAQGNVSGQRGLKGIDLNSMRAPGQTTNSMTNTATPTANQYGFQTFASDGTTACTTEPCAKFRLHYLKEDTNAVVSKDSLN